MITNWLLTGDCHRDFSRFKNYPAEVQNDSETAVIILGDAALNWTIDGHDADVKNFLRKSYNFRIYCVRGNHEARPQNVPDMKLIYDYDVCGEVYMQDAWPNIRYFKDWGIYTIDGLRVAVIGGAYSVDKFYRLDRAVAASKNPETDWTGWFADEQLSDEEMLQCTIDLTNQEVDMVLTHTCPVCWEPVDLFLRGIDQSKVDKSMELFLEEIGKCFGWKVWCFGHYHADRIERPGVEQFFRDTEHLKAVWQRWEEYWRTDGESLDWWLVKSPMFYADDEVLNWREEYWREED